MVYIKKQETKQNQFKIPQKKITLASAEYKYNLEPIER